MSKGKVVAMGKSKILVGMPTMGAMEIEAVKSLMQLEFDGSVDIVSESLVYDARDKIAMDAIASKVDWVMWLDSDIVYPPNIIRKLMSRNKDMITGIYHKRTSPYTPCIYKLDDQKLVPYLDYPDDGLFQVEAAGFGCMLMKASVIRAIYNKFGGCFFPINGIGGEDLSFIRRAKEVGVEVWCDSSIKCGHIGRQIVMPDKSIVQMPE